MPAGQIHALVKQNVKQLISTSTFVSHMIHHAAVIHVIMAEPVVISLSRSCVVVQLDTTEPFVNIHHVQDKTVTTEAVLYPDQVSTVPVGLVTMEIVANTPTLIFMEAK
ncbi:uncharacterized protein LOC143053799 [Mytilus galloprovincialis]|uniref:uncharacterized protein LOC143053799 n=1 Tax=Mytilus galloprovincialis TaxID=29158 RepID=UPI003F7C1F06